MTLASVTANGIASAPELDLAVSRRMRSMRRVFLIPRSRGRFMPVMMFNGQQFVLQPGPNRLGGGATADVVVGGEVGILAIVDLASDGRATIRNNGDQVVARVNGMTLGGPTPLLHGDKVEISGSELIFVEDAKGGATQFVSAAEVAAIAAKRSGPARATAATGGRLVSLVDGKEYAIPDAGVVIGRDASADIVVAQTAVSRRHAQVIATANGYVVNDLSTNGIAVNGVKVNASQPLSRADVILVGTEEFRFYADVAPAAPRAAPPSPAPAPIAAAPIAAAPIAAAPIAAAPIAAAPIASASAPAPVAPRPVPAPSSPPTPQLPRPATPPPPAAASPAKAPPAPAKAPPAPTKAPPAPTKAPPPAVKAPPPSIAASSAEAPREASREPAPSKGVPMWLGLSVILVIAAAAAYLIITLR